MKLLIFIGLASLFQFVTTSVSLECSFAFTAENLYTCINLNLNIEKNNVELKDVKGKHNVSKNDDDVVSIFLLSSGMKRLPRGIFKLFKNLKKYVVQGLDTVDEYLDSNALIRGDFQGAKNLSTILLMSVVLDQLRARVFEGADHLLYLTIEACRITSVDKDAFKGLKKLRSLGLKYNYISTLHPGTFSELFDLQHLLLSGNFLKRFRREHLKGLRQLNRLSLIGNVLTEVDPRLIDGLRDLEHLYLDQNLCIDEHFGSDGIPFSKFPKTIKSCSTESSIEETLKKKSDEVKLLEKEVTTLQILVEKYKHGNNCGSQSINVAGNSLWLKRNEMP